MTQVRPVNPGDIGPTDLAHDLARAQPSRPRIETYVVPKPDGNNSLPPRTNLRGPPSAFQDSITATGGNPPVTTTDPEEAREPVSRWALFQEWMSRNKTALVMVGLVVFAAMSISR